MEPCFTFLRELATKTPKNIKGYKKMMYQLEKRIESNIYRDPNAWKYTLYEISMFMEKYIKPNCSSNEDCKLIFEQYSTLLQRCKM